METRSSPISVLSRPSFIQGLNLGNTQVQVDSLVSRFVEEAANPRTLAALMVGGMAYRLGRLGVMGFPVGAYGRTPAQIVSIAVGLGSEVTAFEFTNRALQTIRAHGRAPLQGNSNIWSWSGPGGWREGLISSAITFGLLKGAGHLAREENIVLQHAFQASAMVTGHQTTGLLGITPRPEGTLAEQFLHAEAVNLQLAAGMGLVHAIAPGIHAWERSLDLNRSVGAEHYASPLRDFSSQSAWIALGVGGRSPDHLLRPERNPFIHMMSGTGDGGGDGKDPPRKGSLEDAITDESGERLVSPDEGLSDQNLADTIYRDVPNGVRYYLNLNLMAMKDAHEELKNSPLCLLAFALAETLNTNNNILQNFREGLPPEELKTIEEGRNWIRDRFDGPESDPARRPFLNDYRRALSFYSLTTIYDDITQLPPLLVHVRLARMLRKIPDQDPFNENLPWIVREIGKDGGDMHRNGYLAIISYGIEKGWLSPQEEGIDLALVEKFRENYRRTYPQGTPPITTTFIDSYFGTARFFQQLRDKWGSSHPLVRGFNRALEILGSDLETVHKRFELVSRMKLFVSKLPTN